MWAAIAALQSRNKPSVSCNPSMRREKKMRACAAYCVPFGDVPGWGGRFCPSLCLSRLSIRNLDLLIVRSHLRMVVVAAERRRGLGMRPLETVLARAGKTKDQFYAHCDQIAAPDRAW